MPLAEIKSKQYYIRIWPVFLCQVAPAQEKAPSVRRSWQSMATLTCPPVTCCVRRWHPAQRGANSCRPSCRRGNSCLWSVQSPFHMLDKSNSQGWCHCPLAWADKWTLTHWDAALVSAGHSSGHDQRCHDRQGWRLKGLPDRRIPSWGQTGRRVWEEGKTATPRKPKSQEMG